MKLGKRPQQGQVPMPNARMAAATRIIKMINNLVKGYLLSQHLSSAKECQKQVK